MSTVSYRPIVGFSGFRVGDDGSVWRLWPGNKRKRTPDYWRKLQGTFSAGCLHVSLKGERGTTTRTVAALVLRAFVGPKPLGCAPFHFPDTDLKNCALNNLRWMPRGSRKIGSACQPQPKGEASPLARLTNDQARKALRMISEGFSQKEIAEKFGVGQGAICNLARGKSGYDVGDVSRSGRARADQRGEMNARSKLREEDVRSIREDRRAGLTLREISRKYGVGKSVASAVASGKSWKHVS